MAVSGAAFAQSTVSLTGKLRFAYGDAKTSAGAKTTGVGVTDGDWNIAAVEDLGGGLKAGANMALRLRGRDAANDSLAGGSFTDGNGARPRDSSVYLTGGFGTVTVGAVEAGNAVLAGVTAGGPTYIGLDTYNSTTAGVVSAASNVDLLSYRTPTMSGFSAVVMMIDSVGGGGAQVTSKSQDANLVGLNYANGPLSVALDVTNYGLNAAIQPAVTGAFTSTGITHPAAAVTTAADSRTRVSANYDLGVARIGAGFQTAKITAGIARKETLMSVSAPLGAFTVGMVYASSKTDGVAGTNTGYDFAVQYALSKRTYVALQGQSFKMANVAGDNTNTRVQLSHSF